jgi:hypothetical protein
MTLPPDAPACLACGAVQSPKTWEYCEIRVERETMDPEAIDFVIGRPEFRERFRFWADGAGPGGVYTVGHSDWAERAEPTEWDRDLFERLVGELRSQGWQPLQRKGGEWWSQRFRRPIGSAST